MTRAQTRVYNRLRKKQVNRKVDVIEATEHYVTFHLLFPGLYVTYDKNGTLLATHTDAERKAGNLPLLPTSWSGEAGGDVLPDHAGTVQDVEDDDVPF